jgi:hypothetical protein
MNCREESGMKSSRFDLMALVERSLTSHCVPRKVVADEFGCSGQLVSKIRSGLLHRSVRPDLPRWRSCEACRLRSPAPSEQTCSLGFPEPEELGPVLAATECAVFVRAQP